MKLGKRRGQGSALGRLDTTADPGASAVLDIQAISRQRRGLKGVRREEKSWRDAVFWHH